MNSKAWKHNNTLHRIHESVGAWDIDARKANDPDFLNGCLADGYRWIVLDGDSAILFQDKEEADWVLEHRGIDGYAQSLRSYVRSLDEGMEEDEDTESGRTYKVGDKGPAGGYVFYDKGNYSDGWRYLEAAPEDITLDGKGDYEFKLYRTSAEDLINNGNRNIVFGFYRTSPDGENLFVNGPTYVKGTSDPNDGKSTGTEIGTGKANTEKLVSKMGSEAYSDPSGNATTENYAAKLCADYTYGGYNDWFLPSKDELTAMVFGMVPGKGTQRDPINTGLFDKYKIEFNQVYWSSSESPTRIAYNACSLNTLLRTVISGTRKHGHRVRAIRSF